MWVGGASVCLYDGMYSYRRGENKAGRGAGTGVLIRDILRSKY